MLLDDPQCHSAKRTRKTSKLDPISRVIFNVFLYRNCLSLQPCLGNRFAPLLLPRPARAPTAQLSSRPGALRPPPSSHPSSPSAVHTPALAFLTFSLYCFSTRLFLFSASPRPTRAPYPPSSGHSGFLRPFPRYVFRPFPAIQSPRVIFNVFLYHNCLSLLAPWEALRFPRPIRTGSHLGPFPRAFPSASTLPDLSHPLKCFGALASTLSHPCEGSWKESLRAGGR